MIIRSKPTQWDVLFTLKGSIAKHIAIRLLAFTALACAVTFLSARHPELFVSFSAAPFTLIGLSLSIFMSFRNNACYERWWEGRKQWGQLIVEVRSFLRESADIDAEATLHPTWRLLCGFVHALGAQLRGQDACEAAAAWLPADFTLRTEPNPADAILFEIGRACSGLVRAGRISEFRYQMLEQRLAAMSGVQAACERIKSTPLPFAYTLLLHRTAYLFCGLLPFGLASPLGWATPLVTAIVGYTFFGLDALGEELEDPFGRDTNDLPLDALARIMERDILAAIGVQDLPPLLQPVDFLLQ